MVGLATSLETKRLQGIIRHVEDVQSDCQILGIRLIERGEEELGRQIIARGFCHDQSKFHGIEWEHLHEKNDPLFQSALQHHYSLNDHHPQFFHGGIHEMSRLNIGEMVCDWHSRASELDGGGLRWYITHVATHTFGFSWEDEVGQQIKEFVELLLEHWSLN